MVWDLLMCSVNHVKKLKGFHLQTSKVMISNGFSCSHSALGPTTTIQLSLRVHARTSCEQIKHSRDGRCSNGTAARLCVTPAALALAWRHLQEAATCPSVASGNASMQDVQTSQCFVLNVWLVSLAPQLDCDSFGKRAWFFSARRQAVGKTTIDKPALSWHIATQCVQNLKLELRTVTAENLFECVEQRSSPADHSSRQRKVSECWAPFIPSIYTGPGMVSGVAVSPPNAKGSLLALHPKAQICICTGTARRTTGSPW